MLLNFSTFVVLSVVMTINANPNHYKVIIDDDCEPWKPMPEPHIDEKETEIKFWREKGQQTLFEKLNRKLNTNVAKNVIFFLGDGMSVPTITAARIYQGQINKNNGEESQLFFETFPYTGLSKTYCVDKQVPDSASTSTAYLRGVKGNYATIGVTAKVKPADCESAKLESNRPSSIVKWAQDAGKATGIVTNTRITDASPAGTYAYVPLRDMESDADVLKFELDPKSCNFDIAKQLINDQVGRNLKVIMGGGRKKFLLKNGSEHGKGERLDTDLIEEWKKDKKSRNVTGQYVTTADDLTNVNIQATDHLLGLFADGNLDYYVDRSNDQPTLSQMTETAIKLLQKDPNGFFLFVEGGLIDKAHHQNHAKKALHETIEFAKAVELATKLTSEEDTLIVVTADHSHTMTVNGYPDRGYDILGLYGKAMNGLPYPTLSYANGLGYKPEAEPGKPYNMQNDNTNDINYRFPALVLKDWESHGGDDVAVYANGPQAHLFSGNYEQSYIPIAEAYIANITIPDETYFPPNPVPEAYEGSTINPTNELTTEQPPNNSAIMFTVNDWILKFCILFAFKNIFSLC